MNNKEDQKRNFLAVEDDFLTLNTIKNTLEKGFNCNVVTATNGKEALELSGNAKFDVILTDFDMPIMNGEEFAIKVINDDNNPNCKTPIIFVSGQINSICSELQEHGIGKIGKPFSSSMIINKTKDFLS